MRMLRKLQMFILVMLGIIGIWLFHISIDNVDSKINGELEMKDQGKYKMKNNLLNLTNFKWILNNESICERRSSEVSHFHHRIMPILIHSARSHFKERMTIRNTWGSLSIFKDWSIRLIFLLGEGISELNETLIENEKIIQEQQQFGDLVMGNFFDSYHNLTYKHLMGYKWIVEFCPDVEMVTKSDDDVFLDIIQWLDFLSSKIQLQIKSENWREPEIFCKVWRHSKVHRNSSHKWYVSYEDWPDQYYPPFCSGRAYAIKMDLLRKIYEISNEVKFNGVDDVFVTMFSIQHLKSKYNESIYLGDISEACSAITVRKYCLGKERNFKTITVLPHNNNFVENMNCMWNLTLQEYFSKLSLSIASKKTKV